MKALDEAKNSEINERGEDDITLILSCGVWSRLGGTKALKILAMEVCNDKKIANRMEVKFAGIRFLNTFLIRCFFNTNPMIISWALSHLRRSVGTYLPGIFVYCL